MCDIMDILFVLFAGMMIVLMFIACTKEPNIEIQKVKQIDDGYYITINNQVYEYLEG